jgi:pyruvate dehydrogenase E2 component (dihydrolipoamide acetyltransferase)
VGRIAVKEGDKINVGQLILVIEGTGGEKTEEPAADKGARSSGPAPGGTSKAPAASPTRRPANIPAVEVPAEGWNEEIVSENPAAGPHVRRMSRDLGIDLRVIRGSGKSGRILGEDLKAYVAQLRALAMRAGSTPIAAPAGPTRQAPASIDFSKWGPVTRKPLTPMRKAIGERMVESATTLPVVTQFDDADVTRLEELRRQYAAAYEAKGARLTPTALFSRLSLPPCIGTRSSMRVSMKPPRRLSSRITSISASL